MTLARKAILPFPFACLCFALAGCTEMWWSYQPAPGGFLTGGGEKGASDFATWVLPAA
jgi:hypothetical protein